MLGMPITGLEYHGTHYSPIERLCSPVPLWSVPGRYSRELFHRFLRTLSAEDVMRAYLNNMPMKIWLLLVLSTLALAYPLVRIVVPAVIHAVVPEVVRSVLRVI